MTLMTMVQAKDCQNRRPEKILRSLWRMTIFYLKLNILYKFGSKYIK